MKVNTTRLSLSWDNSAKHFMPCPDPHIIWISVTITATQIVGPDPLPWNIS